MQKIWFSLGLFVLLNGFLIGSSSRVMAESASEIDADSISEPERIAYLDPQQRKQLALAKTLKEHETVWLEVSYPESSEITKVLAIAHPPLIPDKQGAILLLHDKGQHADWPEVIHPLRMNLPKAGWYTLSVNLPEETRMKFLPRKLDTKAFDQVILNESLKKKLDSGVRVRHESDKNDAQAVESTSGNTEVGPVGDESSKDQNADEKELVDIDLAAARNKPQLNKIPYETRALSHIQKAYEYLQAQSYQNIVIIAHRQSSELVYAYIKAHLGELKSPGFSLILIEPSLPETYLVDLSEWLGKEFQAPILEIINRGDIQANIDAEQRKLSILMTGTQSYKQLFLRFNNNEIFDENLTRRIKSWLEVNAPGMKVAQ
tara:strand:- start:2522 stop:3646 length:1125 start_codon:yes stop_codon:yes gene_type:complete